MTGPRDGPSDESHPTANGAARDYDPRRDGDATLAVFADHAERRDTRVRVTLTVKGILVTGMIVSEQAFWDIARGLAPGGSKGESPPPGTEGDGLPLFIHLSDASYVAGGVRVPRVGTICWRGRISEVDGFHFGRLGTGKARA